MTRTKATTVRLAQELRPRVDAFAKRTHRSMNGAVNYLVARALDEIERAGHPTTQE